MASEASGSAGDQAGGNEAWVTLATNDRYALGALVLANSLRRVNTTRSIVALVTHEVTEGMRAVMSQVFDLIHPVSVLDSQDAAHLALLSRPDLGITFTKLHCWRLTQFSKCVFLDADTLLIKNCDELFDREELSAAPDCGWPDCFNSGVFVYRPSEVTFQALLQFAIAIGSFDGGDQGLLNAFFSDWPTKDISRHLPFTYNMVSSAVYTYSPAYQHFINDVRIVHFIGPYKPWMHTFNEATRRVNPIAGCFHGVEYLQLWWDIYVQHVHPSLNPALAGLAGQLALVTLGQETSVEQRALDDRARLFSWEQGQADYLGADAFANIQKKLDEALVAEQGSAAPPAANAVVPVQQSKPVAPPEEPKAPIAPVVIPEVSTLSLTLGQETAAMPQTVSATETAVAPPPEFVPVLPSPPVQSPTKSPVAVETPPLVPQSPTKATPAPLSLAKAAPVPQSPTKSSPVPQSPTKATPVPQSPTKATPVSQSPTKAAPAPQSPTKAAPAPQSPTKATPVPQSPTKSPVTTVAIPPKPLDAGPIPPEPISPPPALPPPLLSRAAPGTPPAAASGTPPPLAASSQPPAAASPAAPPQKPSKKGPKKPKSP